MVKRLWVKIILFYSVSSIDSDSSSITVSRNNATTFRALWIFINNLKWFISYRKLEFEMFAYNLSILYVTELSKLQTWLSHRLNIIWISNICLHSNSFDRTVQEAELLTNQSNIKTSKHILNYWYNKVEIFVCLHAPISVTTSLICKNIFVFDSLIIGNSSRVFILISCYYSQ